MINDHRMCGSGCAKKTSKRAVKHTGSSPHGRGGRIHMEIYLSSRRCPKCGDGDTSHSSHAAKDGHRFRYTGSCPGPYDEEHIARHCRRCHYVWAEACVDSAKATE